MYSIGGINHVEFGRPRSRFSICWPASLPVGRAIGAAASVSALRWTDVETTCLWGYLGLGTTISSQFLAMFKSLKCSSPPNAFLCCWFGQRHSPTRNPRDAWLGRQGFPSARSHHRVKQWMHNLSSIHLARQSCFPCSSISRQSAPRLLRGLLLHLPHRIQIDACVFFNISIYLYIYIFI